MDELMPLSSAMEDYLETMLGLLESDGIIRVTDIAHKLNVAKPTVSQTISKLKRQGMVLQESYGTISLTVSGKAYAAKVRCRHTILRDFLVKIIGVEEKTAEEEACRMEHVLSKDTMLKLSKYMLSNCPGYQHTADGCAAGLVSAAGHDS